MTVTNPENVEITRMQIDTAQIGGRVIEILPELNRVTITATSDTQPGTYDLPVRVFDKDNGYYDTTVSVTVTKRVKQAGEVDWDEQVIYFMLTDRFYNGDPVMTTHIIKITLAQLIKLVFIKVETLKG